MIYTIPTRSDTTPYQEEVECQGVYLTLKFRYNPIDDLWRVSFWLNGQPAVENISLVCRPDLLKRYRWVVGLPVGYFDVIDLDGLGRNATKELMGTKVILTYREL